MELIGSGLGHHVDLRPWITAVFGREIMGLDANFLNGVWGREIDAGVARRVIEIAAVEGEEVHIRPAALTSISGPPRASPIDCGALTLRTPGRIRAKAMTFRPLRGRS